MTVKEWKVFVCTTGVNSLLLPLLLRNSGEWTHPDCNGVYQEPTRSFLAGTRTATTWRGTRTHCVCWVKSISSLCFCLCQSKKNILTYVPVSAGLNADNGGDAEDEDDEDSDDKAEKIKNPNSLQSGKWQLGLQGTTIIHCKACWVYSHDLWTVTHLSCQTLVKLSSSVSSMIHRTMKINTSRSRIGKAIQMQPCPINPLSKLCMQVLPPGRFYSVLSLSYHSVMKTPLQSVILVVFLIYSLILIMSYSHLPNSHVFWPVR